MRLTSTQVERTLSQFEAQPIPDDHPVVPQLNQLFGDHTFFLDSNGLNVVEAAGEGTDSGKVVNLANWANPDLTSLAPHEPQPTGVVVQIGTQH